MRAYKMKLAITLLSTSSAVTAAETIRYTYDTRARLTAVVRTCNAAPATTRYLLDRADNRIRKTVQAGSTVANASFEMPEVGTGFQYEPAVAGMTFGPGTGVAGNGSDWGFAPALDGDQVAFVQSGPTFAGTMSQTVTGLTSGARYTLSFLIAQRPGYARNPIFVSADGVLLGTYDPPSTGFTCVTTPAFTASGTSATITFTGQLTTSDAASALDAVSVAPSPP